MSEAAEPKPSTPHSWTRRATGLLGGLMSLAGILFALNAPRSIGLALFTEQYLALILAFTLAVVYLIRPAFSGKLFILDILCSALGFGCAMYVALFYPVLVNELVYKPLDGLMVSVILALLTVEAVRRVTGWGLTIVVLAFIAYGLFGHLLPFGMSRQILPDRLAIYLAMDTNAMIGLPLMVAATVVFAFIFMGQVLSRCGGSDFFNDLALSLVGRTRGGAAKIAVVSSFLFGSVSGSAVANVVASGVVTVPLMKRAGYKPHVAASIEALASTGGQLAPPIMGAAAFLMAEFLEIPYSTVVLAAVIPTFLYYGSIFLFVDMDAAAKGLRLPEDVEIPRVGAVLRDGWQFIVPFVVLLGTLFLLNWRPELSALAAAATLAVLALVFPYRGRRAGVRDLVGTLSGTGISMIEIIVISAAAGLVIGVLNLSGLSFSLTLQLVQLAAGNLIVLLMIAAVVSIVLGMGMPTVGVYVLLASLIGPSLVKAGIDPLAAHMFLLYFGMLSMITPPVALASFTAASLAGADALKTGWYAVRLGWVAYLIPFVMVFEPAIVMQGEWSAIAWHSTVAVLGVFFATCAIYGFIFRKLEAWERICFLAAATVALLPAGLLFDQPEVVEAVALAAGFLLLGRIYLAGPYTEKVLGGARS